MYKISTISIWCPERHSLCKKLKYLFGYFFFWRYFFGLIYLVQKLIWMYSFGVKSIYQISSPPPDFFFLIITFTHKQTDRQTSGGRFGPSVDTDWCKCHRPSFTSLDRGEKTVRQTNVPFTDLVQKLVPLFKFGDSGRSKT